MNLLVSDETRATTRLYLITPPALDPDRFAKELEEALAAGPDIIMLDEFSLSDMRAAVALRDARGTGVKLEASGSVSLQTVRAIAESGVDYISVGSITKHVRAVDLSMRLEFSAG